MSRRVNKGIVWRPAEVLLLLTAALLAISLVWVIHETNRQNEQLSSVEPIQQQIDDSLQQIMEQDIKVEQQIDDSYKQWERSSLSALEGAADDIGSSYDESTY